MISRTKLRSKIESCCTPFSFIRSDIRRYVHAALTSVATPRFSFLAVPSIKEIEESLQAITTRQGANVNEFVRLVKENEEVLKGMRVSHDRCSTSESGCCSV